MVCILAFCFGKVAYLERIAILIDRLNETIGRVVSWLTTLLVVIVSYDVFARYLLRRSSVAVQELEWHLFAFLFLMASAYTLKHDRHVRVDILYARLSRRGRAWIDLVGSILFLIPFSILVIWSSKDFVINSFLVMEGSPDPGGLPARYLLKASIPVGFFLLLLQGLALAIASLITLKGKGNG